MTHTHPPEAPRSDEEHDEPVSSGDLSPVSAPVGHPPPPPQAKPPGVAVVFIAFLVAIVVLFIGQAIVGAGIGIWRASRGASTEEITSAPFAGIEPQGLLILMYLPVAVALVVVPLVMARRLGGSLREVLGLRRATLPRWGYPVLLVASWVPFVVAVGCAALVARLSPPSQELERLWAPGPAPLAIAYVLFIAFAPGFAEEVFFRGFMQRRLLRRWSPWWAIVVASICFALLHVAPTAMALAFPLGLWLGVLAWRTGSIWPSVFCHAVINGVWNAGQIVVHRDGPVDYSRSATSGEWIVTGVLGAIALAAFVLAIVMLSRLRPQARPC